MGDDLAGWLASICGGKEGKGESRYFDIKRRESLLHCSWCLWKVGTVQYSCHGIYEISKLECHDEVPAAVSRMLSSDVALSP